MAPSVDEAIGFADVLRKTIGGTDGEWSSEIGDNAYHAKLTNHGMRCLLVLAAEVQRLRGGSPAAAFDAHTAEVVERCLEIIGRHLAGYMATHPAFGIGELVNEIRALAPRKEG